MLEFVTSRVWMALFGLALTASIAGAFADIDKDAVERAALDRASAFTDLVARVRASGQDCEVTVDARDYLVGGSQYLVVANGSVWVHDGDRSHAVEGPRGLTLVEGGVSVDSLTIRWGDCLEIRTTVVGRTSVVQLEKVEATSFTASTNFLHSSSVL